MISHFLSLQPSLSAWVLITWDLFPTLGLDMRFWASAHHFLLSRMLSFLIFACQFWSSQVFWLMLPQPSATKATDSTLCTVLSRLHRARHSHQNYGWNEGGLQLSLLARCRQVCLLDTAPCTAEPRCVRSHTVRAGHKRHTHTEEPLWLLHCHSQGKGMLYSQFTWVVSV